MDSKVEIYFRIGFHSQVKIHFWEGGREREREKGRGRKGEEE